MKRFTSLVALAAVLTISSMASAQVTKVLDRSGAIHDPAGAGNIVDSTDYYGSGNDDGFSEYGVATFTFNATDFGLPAISSLSLFEYTITHNDRGFSDGAEFELFLTTDDFDGTYSSISYDPTLTNGLVAAQYSNLSSLGVFAYMPEAGGTQEVLNIGLSAAQEADLISEINAGSEFSILITATAADADVTFTGFDDQFELGGQPSLTLGPTAAVPEPTALAILSMFGIAGFTRRRR